MLREISLEESKKIQIEIMKSIDSFCRLNGINYSLAAGSAIGAVRHKGFIPWDDDIDIIMMRKDYNVFVSSYKDDRFSLLHYSTNPTWDWYFSCVEDPRTMAYWGEMKRSTRGIWVSIFPVDYVPEDDNELNKLVNKIQHQSCKNLFLILKRSYPKAKSSFILNGIKKIGRVLMRPVPYGLFYKKIDEIVAKYLNKHTNRVSSVAGWTFNTIFTYPADCLSEYIDVDFEDMKCMLCKGYDEYLRKQYGDYMVLPPIEEQVPKHEATIYWKD